MRRIIITLLVTLALLSIPAPASADHGCDEHDCPLWAKYGGYATPSYSSSNSYNDYRYTNKYRAPPVTHYEFIEVQHPPRHMYVHYNQNYYDHYGDGRYSTARTRYDTQTHYNRYQRHSSPTILRGNGFNRYY